MWKRSHSCSKVRHFFCSINKTAPDHIEAFSYDKKSFSEDISYHLHCVTMSITFIPRKILQKKDSKLRSMGGRRLTGGLELRALLPTVCMNRKILLKKGLKVKVHCHWERLTVDALNRKAGVWSLASNRSFYVKCMIWMELKYRTVLLALLRCLGRWRASRERRRWRGSWRSGSWAARTS